MTQTTSLAAAQARIIKLEARLKAADELATYLNYALNGPWMGYHFTAAKGALEAYRATGEQP